MQIPTVVDINNKEKKVISILIFANLFTKELPPYLRFLKKWIISFNKIKLNSLIGNLSKIYSKNVEIKLINHHETKFNLKNIKNEYVLGELRQELNRDEYANIVSHIKKNTRTLILHLTRNMSELNSFNFGTTKIVDLLEIHLIRFLNQNFGDIELINAYIKRENPRKIIFFNCNRDIIKIFKKPLSNINTHYYNNKLNTIITKFLNEMLFIRFNLMRIIIGYLNKYKKLNFPLNKTNVIFIVNTINHFKSIKPIYQGLKGIKDINPIFYVQKNHLPINNLSKYYNFLRGYLSNWKRNQNKIYQEMGVFHNLLRYFYDIELRYLLSQIFNEYSQLSKVFHKEDISVVTISNQNVVKSKVAAIFFKLINIPTIYIPHASVPIDEQIMFKKHLSYLALWGEKDIEFYKNQLGMVSEKLIITGNPAFESFYTKTLKEINEVNDMFSNRIYKFNIDEFNILLATNTYDLASNKELLTTTVNSLKKLNLIENLIVKLHPSETGLNYKPIFKSLKVNPIMVRDYNILELIKSSDLLISCISSITLETMIIGTPVIQADFVNLDFMFIQPYAFTNDRFIRVANTSKSLTEHIKELSQSKENFIEYSNKLKESSKLFSSYVENEPPTKKIINLILKIINKNSLQ